MRLKYILLSAMACAVVLFAGCKQSQPGINVTPKEFEKKTTEGVYKVAKAQYAFNKTKDDEYVPNRFRRRYEVRGGGIGFPRRQRR